MSTEPIRRLRGFRADIEGLRAFAILSVVLYHAEVPFVSGGFIGVDVFFVLSGYLITGILVREVERTKRVNLLEFWARRMRRLLPAATVVLLATAAAAPFAVPPTMRATVADSIAAAALYTANWYFLTQSLDYLAGQDLQSPAMHFWSLGVEEQFYVVWPLAIVLLLAVARRWQLPRRQLLTGFAVVIWVASFTAVLATSTTSQPFAFFGSPTRFWELATGALLVLGAETVARVDVRRRIHLQWLGAALLGWSVLRMGAAIDDGHPFPGAITLVPVLGTVALIVGGQPSQWKHERTAPVYRFLALPRMQWFGAISYAWYLWHWPLLALYWYRFGPEQPWSTNLVLVEIALVLAWVTHRFIENPVRFAKSLKSRAVLSVAIGVVLMALPLGAATFLAATDAGRDPAAQRPRGFVPLPAAALADEAVIYRDGCTVDYDSTEQLENCVYGDRNAKPRVVLLGDSHAASVFAAFNRAGHRLHYRLDVRVKLGCTSAEVTQWHYKFDQPFTACTQWRTNTLIDLVQRPADVVVIVNNANPTPDVYSTIHDTLLDDELGRAAWVKGYARLITRLQAAGSQVLVVRDNPRVPRQIPDCVSLNMANPAACDFARADGLIEPAADVQAAQLVPGTTVLDLTDRICDATTCFAVRDGVLIWQKGNHLTNTFARTLAPAAEQALAPLLARATRAQ